MTLSEEQPGCCRDGEGVVVERRAGGRVSKEPVTGSESQLLGMAGRCRIAKYRVEVEV